MYLPCDLMVTMIYFVSFACEDLCSNPGSSIQLKQGAWRQVWWERVQCIPQLESTSMTGPKTTEAPRKS